MPIDQPKNSPKKPLDNLVRYSSMGFQMGATILLFTWLGIKLDGYLGLKIPIFTLVFALLSIGVSLWYFIKDFLPKK